MKLSVSNISKTLIALFVTSFMFVNNSLQAQEGVKVGFRVSPLVGVAVVNDSSKQVPEGLTTKAEVGFDVGLILNVGLSQSASLTTGISYQQVKFSFSQPIPTNRNITDSTKAEIKGLSTETAVVIPFGLKLRSPEIGTGIHLWANVGAQANINMSYESTEEVLFPETDRAGNTTYVVRELTESGTDVIEKVTASFVPAFGLDIGNLQVGTSYHWGLMNILNKNSTSPNPTRKLSYVALNLGYFF